MLRAIEIHCLEITILSNHIFLTFTSQQKTESITKLRLYIFAIVQKKVTSSELVQILKFIKIH